MNRFLYKSEKKGLAFLFSDEGWTFIEVIVVLAIILILSGSIGIIAFRYISQAQVASAKNQIQLYSLALNSYALDNKVYPSSSQNLEALWTKPSGSPEASNWCGPYVEKRPSFDPWGNPYEYQVPGPHGLPFALLSLGADGCEGGEGEAADISSWE